MSAVAQAARPDVRPDLAEVERLLLARWPETRIEPSLDRIRLLLDFLGEPQRRYRSVHLTGTNGKTSTARLVEAVLAASGHRTGRLTSPHLTTIRERIALAGQPIGEGDFVEAWREAEFQAECVDAVMEHPLSFFEMTVAMGYLAFAKAAVDVAVVEVGMGGRWDATNVIDAGVSVILPIALDHTDYLGPTTVDIAREKAGIIAPGSVVVSARQSPEVLEVIQERADAVGARLLVLDRDFAVEDRAPVAGGQRVTVHGLHRIYDVHLALRGRHQADNAACALVAAEALLGRALDPDAVRRALAGVTSPGRLDVRRGRPTVVLDAAHNPHGARALVEGLDEIAPSHRRYAVVAAMADKDVEGLLRELEPAVTEIVCTANSSPRSMAAADLAAVAATVFPPERVHIARTVESALAVARGRAAAPGAGRESVVVVTGSVVTVADAEGLLPASPGPDRTVATPDRPMVQPLPG